MWIFKPWCKLSRGFYFILQSRPNIINNVLYDNFIGNAQIYYYYMHIKPLKYAFKIVEIYQKNANYF